MIISIYVDESNNVVPNQPIGNYYNIFYASNSVQTYISINDNKNVSRAEYRGVPLLQICRIGVQTILVPIKDAQLALAFKELRDILDTITSRDVLQDIIPLIEKDKFVNLVMSIMNHFNFIGHSFVDLTKTPFCIKNYGKKY